MILDYHVADCRRLQYGLSKGGPFRGASDFEAQRLPKSLCSRLTSVVLAQFVD